LTGFSAWDLAPAKSGDSPTGPTLANVDSRSIQDTMDFLAGQLNITKDQAVAQIAQSNFLKVPATVADTANAAVLLASGRARMLTGTVVNATAGAALD
jgi:hypothetical protein